LDDPVPRLLLVDRDNGGVTEHFGVQFGVGRKTGEMDAGEEILAYGDV
jgi:hypothetical protein